MLPEIVEFDTLTLPPSLRMAPAPSPASSVPWAWFPVIVQASHGDRPTLGQHRAGEVAVVGRDVVAGDGALADRHAAALGNYGERRRRRSSPPTPVIVMLSIVRSSSLLFMKPVLAPPKSTTTPLPWIVSAPPLIHAIGLAALIVPRPGCTTTSSAPPFACRVGDCLA